MDADFRRVVSGINGKCTCGRTHSVPHILVDFSDVLNVKQAQIINQIFPHGALLLVADENTYAKLGETVRKCIVDELGRPVRVCVFSNERLLEPDGESLLRVFNSVSNDIVGLVAVGAGTINDIVKYVATKTRLGYLVYPTAPSMDGYISANAAILVRGIKRTLAPFAPPRAVLVDVECVATAPARMIAAGYADLVTKGISQADWILGRAACGEYWCERSAVLVKPSVEYCLNNAISIGRAERDSVEKLLEGLLVSGISLQTAGSSRPGSGSEHMLAHFIEVMSLIHGEEYDLHGIRVGISGLVVTAMYERLLRLPAQDLRDRLDAETLADAVAREQQRLEDIGEVYGPFSGEVLSYRKSKDCRSYVQTKRDMAAAIAASWNELRKELASVLPNLNTLKRCLIDAGAAVRLPDASVSPERMRNAIIYSKDMRDRYTILDLLCSLNLLDEFADKAINAVV